MHLDGCTGTNQKKLGIEEPTQNFLTDINEMSRKIAIEFPNDWRLPSELISVEVDYNKIRDVLGYGQARLDESMNNTLFDYFYCRGCNVVVYRKFDYKLSPSVQKGYNDYFCLHACKCSRAHELDDIALQDILKAFDITEHPHLNSVIKHPLKVENCDIKTPDYDSILPLAESTDTHTTKKIGVLGRKNESVEWNLPAQGEIGENCGEDIELMCYDCGCKFTVAHQCLKRECPNCGSAWSYVESKNASFRLWYGREYLHQNRGYARGRLLHIIVSPPPYLVGDVDNMSLNKIRKLRENCYKILKNHGVTGGCVIIHPYRQDNESHHYDIPGFHFHVIAYAPSNVLPGGLKSDGNWVFKVVRDKDSGTFWGFNNVKSLIKNLSYQLRHAGVVDDLHGITWFGDFSYNKLSEKMIFGVFEYIYNSEFCHKRVCPYCGSSNVGPGEVVDWTCGYRPDYCQIII